MLIQQVPPLHLTYSMNVHPGESWADVCANIAKHAVSVKQRVAADQPFGLGLRLSRRACDELQDPHSLAALRELLAAHDLYVFTINGFPYGNFHGQRVGVNVYAPDWRDSARRDYTVRLAKILSDLLPPGVSGSISTVPGSFRPWVGTRADVKAMVANLVQCAEAIRRICTKRGCDITTALEPEPGCWLESSAETIRFFLEELPDWTRPFLSVCVDTCHLAVQFEQPAAVLRSLRAAGVRIGKIQLSAAIETRGNALWARLRDEVYLHQVRARYPDGAETFWVDMPEACEHLQPGDLVRIHFHVPLYCSGGDGWVSTTADLSDDFFNQVCRGATAHVEVETYTFEVLPASWKLADVTESIVRDIQWVRQRLLHRGD